MGACGSCEAPPPPPDDVSLFLSSIGKMKNIAPFALSDDRRELRGRDLQRLRLYAAFSPAIALWELASNEGTASLPPAGKPTEEEQDDDHNEMQALCNLEANCWTFDTALLFVDISGFTNLCTRLEVDALQRCINSYLTKLIDVVVEHGGDVLRFAGDALMCSCKLPPIPPPEIDIS